MHLTESQYHALLVMGPIAAKYLLDGVIGSLEAPDATSSKSYRFWFKFLNYLAANWKRSNVVQNGAKQ